MYETKQDMLAIITNLDDERADTVANNIHKREHAIHVAMDALNMALAGFDGDLDGSLSIEELVYYAHCIFKRVI